MPGGEVVQVLGVIGTLDVPLGPLGVDETEHGIDAAVVIREVGPLNGAVDDIANGNLLVGAALGILSFWGPNDHNVNDPAVVETTVGLLVGVRTLVNEGSCRKKVLKEGRMTRDIATAGDGMTSQLPPFVTGGEVPASISERTSWLILPSHAAAMSGASISGGNSDVWV